jgi:hypothetical protein
VGSCLSFGEFTTISSQALKAQPPFHLQFIAMDLYFVTLHTALLPFTAVHPLLPPCAIHSVVYCGHNHPLCVVASRLSGSWSILCLPTWPSTLSFTICEYISLLLLQTKGTQGGVIGISLDCEWAESFTNDLADKTAIENGAESCSQNSAQWWQDF